MIFVDRGGVQAPGVLNGVGSRGKTEREKAIALYRAKANREKKFTYSAYKSAEVTAALEQLFHRKCAYCESNYAKVQPVDVEHFRPKGGVEVDGRLMKPGYYWLAAEWSNLFPSCIDCNRQRTHEFPEEGPTKGGKANIFPIANEARRAKMPGEEIKERPLLLCPCTDDPGRHLEFDDEGNVKHRPRSRKGKVSIAVYGLRRPALVQSRKDYAVDILASIARLRLHEASKRKYPTDARFDAAILDEMKRLRKFAAATSEYSGMAAQLIERHYRPLR